MSHTCILRENLPSPSRICQFAVGSRAIGGNMHWVLHVLGIDTQQSYFYDFWSGIATQFSVVAGSVVYYRKNICHRAWCLRVGKHSPDGTPWCTRHHPREFE